MKEVTEITNWKRKIEFEIDTDWEKEGRSRERERESARVMKIGFYPKM